MIQDKINRRMARVTEVSNQFVPMSSRTMPTRTQVNSYPLWTRTYAMSYPIPSRTQVIAYPIPTRTYPSHLVPTTISYPTNNLKDFRINFGTYYTLNYVTYQLSVLCILRERLSVKLFFCDRQRILSKTVSRHHTSEDDELEPLFAYMERNWVSSEQWPPHSWSVYRATMHIQFV